MTGFDRDRFVESSLAAILGAVAYGYMAGGTNSVLGNPSAAKNFQRSLILAANFDGMDEGVVEKYLKRVAEFPDRQRKRYFDFVVQTPRGDYDERETAVMIFDHALKGDSEWRATVAAFGFDQASNLEKVFEAVKGEASTVGTWIDQAHERRIEKKRLRHERMSRTWLGRFRLWMERVF